MKSVQTYWHEPRSADGHSARHLHLVSRTAPPRPRWTLLYVTLGVVGVLGAAAHYLVTATVLRHVVDAGFGFALLVTLVGWVHINRVALARSDEPEAGTGRAHVRIVPSRARAAEEAYADDGVVRLTPGERVVLPYDFR
jgi:hypothetical protein